MSDAWVTAERAAEEDLATEVEGRLASGDALAESGQALQHASGLLQATGMNTEAAQGLAQAGQLMQVADQPDLAIAELLNTAAPAIADALGVGAQGKAIAAHAGECFDAARSAVEAADAAIRKEPAFLDEHPKSGLAIADYATGPALFLPDGPDTRQEVPQPAVGPAQLLQANRLLRFYGPLKGDKRLYIDSLQGRHAISQPFVFNARLIGLNGQIELKEMLAQCVTVGVQLQDNSEHAINGYVSDFAYSHSDGGFAYFDASIVPWLWYLNYRTNSRIYQDLSVLEVIERLFTENYQGLAKYELRVSGTYQSENYIVQYDESDLNFFSRLAEEHGLFYYFEHTASEHVLVISDDSRVASYCPPQEAHAQVRYNAGNRVEHEDCVTHLAAQRAFQSSAVSLNTFDFKDPRAHLYVELPTCAQQGNVPMLEVFHGNPAFAYRNASEGEKAARTRMESIECRAKTFMGNSECRGLIAGHSLQLLDHHWFSNTDVSDRDFLILSVDIQAHNNYRNSDAADSYHNSFSCIRRKVPYRPERSHAKPVMRGPQSATVVGPKGEEIHTDEFGRIKVQFSWDRYGRYNERSSCWIRVSQPWAGKGWGSVSIPRIGQEVIIDYLEGDPDRPVCTGRLFNADQPPPYALPDGAHQMGLRTRSTPGGGGHCEMVIHDKKGQEMVNIHSQKDMVTTVLNNQSTIVKGPQQTIAVTTGAQTTVVKKAIQIQTEDEHIFIKAKTSATVALSETHQIVLDEASGSISLVVGESKIIMTKDGAILIQGKQITVTGPQGIHLND